MAVIRKKHKSILSYYSMAAFSLIVVIMLVSISGCGNKAPPETPAQTQPQPVTPEVKPPVQEEIKPQPVTPEVTGQREDTLAVDYSIPDDKVTELKTRAMKTKAVFLVDAYPSGLSTGQSYVYAYGITNQGVSANFMFEIKFKYAKDMSNNPIDKVDEVTLMSWFSRNKFEQIRLEKNEQATMPVGVTVGKEIAPGVAPVVGFYYFDFISKYNDGSIWKEYDKRPFSFRVK